MYSFVSMSGCFFKLNMVFVRFIHVKHLPIVRSYSLLYSIPLHDYSTIYLCILFFIFLPKGPQSIVVYSSCEYLWFCYVGRCLSMASGAVLGWHPGSEPAKPQAAEAECGSITTWPPGWSPQQSFRSHLLLFIFLAEKCRLPNFTSQLLKNISSLVHLHLNISL